MRIGRPRDCASAKVAWSKSRNSAAAAGEAIRPARKRAGTKAAAPRPRRNMGPPAFLARTQPMRAHAEVFVPARRPVTEALINPAAVGAEGPPRSEEHTS